MSDMDVPTYTIRQDIIGFVLEFDEPPNKELIDSWLPKIDEIDGVEEVESDNVAPRFLYVTLDDELLLGRAGDVDAIKQKIKEIIEG